MSGKPIKWMAGVNVDNVHFSSYLLSEICSSSHLKNNPTFFIAQTSLEIFSLSLQNFVTAAIEDIATVSSIQQQQEDTNLNDKK
jgi:hypothetical protein